MEPMGVAVANCAWAVVAELTCSVMCDIDFIDRYSRNCFVVLMPSTRLDQTISPVQDF